jgi:hypothetical protein
MNKIKICISSPPDREKLVAEVFFGDEQWAELNQESGELRLEIYPRQNGQPWSLDFHDVIDALSQARNRLCGPKT